MVSAQLTPDRTREFLGGDADAGRAESDAYRIKVSESAAAAVGRIARTRLDDALAQLGDGLDRDARTAVHEARKDLKKARAVLRLVREPLGKNRYRRENALLREASRALAGTRDASVKIDTLEALAERFGDDLPAATRQLGRELDDERHAAASDTEAGESDLMTAARRATDLIAEVRDEIGGWSFGKSGFTILAAGLERGYRRGRARFADVRDDPTPGNVHEWRKRVKDLWYDLRLLHDTWPPVLSNAAEEAHRLSDLLGDHHDLTVLGEDLDRRSGIDGDEATGIQALIERRQEELLEAAVPIGERLYAEAPQAFAARMRAYWRARNAG